MGGVCHGGLVGRGGDGEGRLALLGGQGCPHTDTALVCLRGMEREEGDASHWVSESLIG